MASKVYCSQCKYYNKCKKTPSSLCHTLDCENIHERCEAPQNIRSTHEKSVSDKYVSCPSIINKFNNCGWFIEKGSNIAPTPSTTTEYVD